MSSLTDLGRALLDLKEDQAKALVKQKLEGGEDPIVIIKECNEAMFEVGQRFERDEYFISELVMSGEIFKGIMSQLEPLLGETQKNPSNGGTVVIGTVKNDIHDIGKNIVITLLKGTGFEVVDLGVDVPAEKFVREVKETGAKVVGLSALLNTTLFEMKNVVDQLIVAGLRDRTTVIIGGAPCNEQVRQYAGADYFAKDAGEGVRICKQIYA
jgi:methylmalonyl-CoA mutase cobalamin-binding domain/chain